jgi:CspA family cold shock protein
MKTGTVKFFNEAKGFGFIQSDDDKAEIFVHHSGLIEKVRENDKVEFETMQGKKGLNAINVKRIR